MYYQLCGKYSICLCFIFMVYCITHTTYFLWYIISKYPIWIWKKYAQFKALPSFKMKFIHKTLFVINPTEKKSFHIFIGILWR